MKTGWLRRAGWGVSVAALGILAGASPTRAQADSQDCRCVDSDGQALANCTCIVMPDVGRITAGLPDGRFGFAFSASRPRLGVTVSTDQEDALDSQGARVNDVMEDGPAEDAGIQAGDIITRVDGRSLFEPLGGDAESDFDLDASVPVQRLLAIARDLHPGESITVEYLRNGEARSATVEVQDLSRAWGLEAREAIRPQMEQLREQLREQRFDLDRFRPELPDVPGPAGIFERERAIQGLGVSRFGLNLTELTPGLAEYFGAEQGVLVSDVDEDSALGLEPGDIILRIGDREVTSPAAARRVLGSYTADEQVTVRVRRRGAELDVLGRLGG